MIPRIFIFLMAMMVAYACASTKKMADVSVGSWDYTVKGTPEGDITGTMVIAKDGDSYTGYLENSQGKIDLRDIAIEAGNINCNFDYMGYQILMTGLFEGNSFNGKVSVDYNDFMMTATKKE